MENKYNVGDEVYYLDTISGKIMNKKIIGIVVTRGLSRSDRYEYQLEPYILFPYLFTEEQLFKSKEELIQSL